MRKLVLLLFFALPLFGQNADVGVMAHTLRPIVPGGGTGDLFITAINHGPDVARNVRVTILATAGVKLREIHATDCVNYVENVVCTLGDLERDASRNLYLTHDFPIGEGTHFLQAEVASDTHDPNPFDNKAPVQVDTIKTAAGQTYVEPHTRRVDPGGTFTGRVYIGGVVEIPPNTRIDLRLTTSSGVIEKVDTPSFWSCTYEGASAQCTTNAASPTRDLPFIVRVSGDLAGGPVVVRAEGRAEVPGHDLTGVSEMTVYAYRHIVVTSTADAGAGSLRAAIDEANASCSPNPCKIVFDLAPDSVIVPSTPFARITADRVVLSSSKPVVIDGSVAGEGLEHHSRCETGVRGLTFRNFAANQGLWLRRELGCTGALYDDRAEIVGNVFERNLRGLRLDGTTSVLVQGNVIRDNTYSGVWMWDGLASFFENTLERNGASGIFLGPHVLGAVIVENAMSDHPHMGLAIARGARHVDARTNTILRSGVQSIDWGINRRDPADDDDSDTENNPPVLLSATYDAAKNVTRVTLTLRTFIYPPGRAILEFFVDDQPYTSRDAERTDGAPFTIDVSGDHRGKWISATSTRAHYLFAKPPRGASSHSYSADQANTSEISNAVLAQ